MRRLEPGALDGLCGPWALVGVRVWDGDAEGGDAVAFGRDGHLLAVGDAASVRSRLPDGSEVVDGRGAFVCPGFVDPHVHVRASASAGLARDISDATGIDSVLEAVHRACSPGSGWVTLVGLQANGLPGRDELDSVSRGRRVRIRERSGHGWLFNSAALAHLGDPTRVPEGVAIERGDDGAPTGFVVDHIGWVGQRLGAVTGEDDLGRAVRAWSRARAAEGVVAIADATATNGDAELRTLERWRANGQLAQELTAFRAPETDVSAAIRVCGTKFARADDARLGAELMRERQFVAVHCVDPAATGAVLAAAARRAPFPAKLRIEHASFIPPDWLPAIRAVDATIVTHPSFVARFGDGYLADASLAPHEWLYRLASWTTAGVPLVFASDAPFGPASPLGALRAAASRRTVAGETLGPAEALSGDPALRAVTSAAAASCGLDELGYGSLRPGGPGCAVVLDGDPRDRGELEEAQVVATVLNGCVRG